MTLFLIAFIAGVLTVLAPCVLPLLPIIVGGTVSGGSNKARAFTVAFSLGVSVILFTLLLKSSTALINIPQQAWWWFSGGNCLAMLVRRDGESLNALLKRLDKAIGMAWSNDVFIDEVNDGESDLP